jgi:pSer/pThr/pTyr-binding forkhead associated (FHA) protein
LSVSTGKGHLVLGSMKSTDLCIENVDISRQHAQFFIQQNKIEVEDLNSLNGIFLNGQKSTRSELHDGDELAFCSFKARVHIFHAC